MDSNDLLAVSTSFLAFSSFLGVMIALVYYAFQIKNLSTLGVIIGAIIYIDSNLLFLYYLKRKNIIK